MRKLLQSKTLALLPFMISSFSITFILFFIDEGNYNLEWMMEWGHWIVFAIYAVPVFFMQVLFSSVLLQKQKGLTNTFLSIFIGSLTGLTLVMGLFFSLS